MATTIFSSYRETRRGRQSSRLFLLFGASSVVGAITCSAFVRTENLLSPRYYCFVGRPSRGSADENSFSSTDSSSSRSLVSKNVDRGRPRREERDDDESADARRRGLGRSREHRRLFADSNVRVAPTKVPLGVWDRLVPALPSPSSFAYLVGHGSSSSSSWRNHDDGVDATVAFVDPASGAADLMSACGFLVEHDRRGGDAKRASSALSLRKDALREASAHLEQCLATFRNVVEEEEERRRRAANDDHDDDDDDDVATATDRPPRRDRTYRARVASSRGRRGRKCPRWHFDHVPVRMLVALEGPGVRYVEQRSRRPSSSSSSGANARDELDTASANSAILDSMGTTARESQARTGDVVLLMGKAWENENFNGHTAVVHKSPNIFPLQGRVLLTVDVINDEFNEDE